MDRCPRNMMDIRIKVVALKLHKVLFFDRERPGRMEELLRLL
jgi:hypothetical protein